MIVTKFGGSSLACAKQLEKVKNIVLSNPERCVVVVSAPGKRNSDDIKITDLLYTLRSHIKYGVPDNDILNMILSRYQEIEEELHLDMNIVDEMRNFFNSLDKDCSSGEVVSRGEHYCAKLVARYLGFTFVDAADILFFTFDGDIDYEKSQAATKAAIEKYGRIVVPGFYGVYPNNDIHLFSRGGSDITGAYMSVFAKASVYENWTDVSGIYAVDPRLAKDAKIIRSISYDELRELSCMGANVLHEDSVKPCQDAEIPIHILNTNEPENEGTIIKANATSLTPITGIAGKKGFVSFTLHKRRMSKEIGFVYRALKIFTKYNVNIEHLPTGMNTVSFIIEEENVRSTMHKIVADLESELDCEVELERDIGMLAIVGEEMRENIIPVSSVLEILKENKIDINCVVKAPDEVTMLVGVKESLLSSCVSVVYSGLRKQGLI
ncbi:aspartate kinase [Treponema rectale]|uniref:Aspartokinase n=1 Tax=Treponema rectale TaxID=744512 RepID=A0A7M1XI84_9SPIR|nr:aspartate kinase [Treponema rectale]